MRARRNAASAKARPDTSHRRALIVSLTLAAWMLAIGVRLVYLQTAQHDWLKKRALVQQQNDLDTSPVRGLVLDRQGRELARSINAESFFVVPGEIQNVEEMAARLAPLVKVEKAVLAARLREAQESKRKFAWVARKLDDNAADAVKALGLKGIYSYKESKRHYPNGQLASHVLGFVGLDEVGLGGVEQFYNERIQGEAGKVFVQRDARGESYASFKVGAQPGQTVLLTIDQMVQYRTEQALLAAVERSRAKSGTAIVLNPRTGEILALANAPTFDPNDVRASSPEARTNQALQNIYEPGSTFKIVAFSAAIEKGLVKPTDRIDCQMGSINVAGRIVHDHHAFGSLTIAEALAKSSNVAAIKLGRQVGDEEMYEHMKRFGFGSKTGVELPGETIGLLRPVARWQPSSMGSIAMGQEVGVTPVQMAAAFGALANDGVRVKPHLVREIRGVDGSLVYQAQPEQRRVVKVETARELRRMLEGVTLNGTAKLAQLNGYTAAGKTGTAQKIDPQTRAYSKTKFIGSFVGFAPVENPSVVIIVVIDEPLGAYHGGDVAAPVFREIAEQILPEMNVAPDTEFKSVPAPGLLAQMSSAAAERIRAEQERERAEQLATLPDVAYGDGRAGLNEIVYTTASRRAIVMPDLRGRSVRDAARVCAQLGLQLEASGEGRALKQSPGAGTEVDAGQIVRIEFGRSG
ncbi:MAG TPA: penicillin-binding protein [Pyrinomonadaceae bacterium]|jgi:cell division protein FtsI (penicillin-binding protein 3)